MVLSEAFYIREDSILLIILREFKNMDYQWSLQNKMISLDIFVTWFIK